MLGDDKQRLAYWREMYDKEHQALIEATDLIRRLYGSFRWDTHTDTQETACKDAEQFLDLPPDKRREWT